MLPISFPVAVVKTVGLFLKPSNPTNPVFVSDDDVDLGADDGDGEGVEVMEGEDDIIMHYKLL